jgi:hypothetical protein
MNQTTLSFSACRRLLLVFASVLLSVVFYQSQAQVSPGVIIRACTDATGKTILSPNYNSITKSFGGTTYHYASATNAGWTLNGNDTSSSVNNIPYKPIASYCGEPCCDLRRGPDHRFSDIVYDSQGNGVYMYHDATNSATLVRFRMGDIIPGAKGFSLLIDTDQKWGAASETNYVAKTTGINGNPGYELELVMETGFRIALYNIDGLGNPSDNIRQSHKIWASNDNTIGKNWTDFSQIVMSATTEHGDPDYFLDFYVPDSAFLNSGFFTSGMSQKLRIIPTTVMAPKPSTAGPISDIYGCDDSTTILFQPKICVSCNDFTGICTPAPTVSAINLTTPVATTANVSGTWTRGIGGSSLATIYLYKNNDTTSIIGTTTITNTSTTTPGAWGPVSISGIAAGTIITAKAKGSGSYESRWCNTSNAVTITSCTPGGVTPLTLTCAQKNGLGGAGFVSGRTISVYRQTSTGETLLASGVPTSPLGNSGLTWDGTTGAWQYGGGCTSGNSQLVAGTYVVYQTSSSCASAVASLCNSQTSGNDVLGTTQTPTLTSPTTIYTNTTSLSGGWGAVGGSTTPTKIRIYRDNFYLGDAAINGSAWSFSLAPYTLTAGEVFKISAQAANTVVGSVNTYFCSVNITSTVQTLPCSNSAPILNVDSLTSKIIPGTIITGTGTVGGTVKLYNNSNSLLATVTVDSAGYWTSAYTALSVTSYYATLSTTGCATVATSASYTVSATNTTSIYCGGGITFSVDASSSGSYTTVYNPNGTAPQITVNGQLVNQPFYSDANWIKGTFPVGVSAPLSSYMIIYVNDVAVANYTLGSASNSWGPVYIGGMLYQGAELTISVAESGAKGEYVCASQKIICACAVSNTPTAPVLGLSSVTAVQSSNKAKIVITNPIDNYFYRLYNTNGTAISDGVWYNTTLGSPTIGRVLTGDSITMNSYTVTESTIADVKALYVGGTESCTSSTQRSITFLPITLLEFRGSRSGKNNILNWRTADEINAAYFQLERSDDGTTFSRLALVATTGSNSSYSFTDATVMPGNNFYRLKLVDADGRFKYSHIILLRNDAMNSITLGAARPNPFKDALTISVYMPVAETIQVQLLDMSGRLVWSRLQRGTRGTNDIQVTGLAGLAHGLYTLRVLTSGQVYQEKVMHGK